MQTNLLVSVVIPLFNEASNIEMLFASLKGLEAQLTPAKVEFIFIDDCSSDNSFQIIKDLCCQYSNLRVLRFTRNYGSHAAILAGFCASKGDCALFIAGDLQDPPELAIEMLKLWQQGFRIVWAARTKIVGQNFMDRFFPTLYWYLSNWISGWKFPAQGVDFALLDRRVVDLLKAQSCRRIPIFMHIAEMGFESKVVFYTKAARKRGKSGWSLPKKIGLVLETLLCSPKPAELLLGIQLILCLLTIIISLYGASNLFIGTSYKLLWLLYLLFGLIIGLQTVIMGFLVVYFHRIMQASLNIPRFVIDEKMPSSHD